MRKVRVTIEAAEVNDLSAPALNEVLVPLLAAKGIHFEQGEGPGSPMVPCQPCRVSMSPDGKTITVEQDQPEPH